MTLVPKLSFSTVAAWLLPLMFTLHLVAHTIFMQVAPTQLCTYHNELERECGDGHWSLAMETLLFIEAWISIAGMAAAIFVLLKGNLKLWGKMGLLFSSILALMIFADAAYYSGDH
ncbi:hypothetical protein PQU94_03675 [Asticcacaulis sp. DXS10W]|uniref:Uncharacterized protein n=1 Tax=Asticcacaulis currens TaxID=2984210 RepID=A0ABT5IB11_9CAUL|nr:hypothetical protein [Asticcacaulis currens]MDC7693380.1 hypothetical protein [Asticcacaulis currens]